jgi:large subunit ribosomal protein L25
MPDTLNVNIREEVGSNAAKRVRKAGCVPAVLYGHGGENMNLALPAEELNAAIRHGSRLVHLKGDIDQTALIREVQWDTFCTQVLHVDLTRVSAGETVQVAVPLELRGEAPGAREGGMIEHVAHEIQLECPASSIPDKIEVSINSLGLSEAIKMTDVQLPQDAKLLSNADTVVAQCSAPVEVAEEELEAAEPAEPEMIGRRAAEEEAPGEA